MATLGWLTLVVFSGFLSLVYAILAFNGLGAYTIGGVPNKTHKKALILGLGMLLVLWWLQVATWSPWSIVAKTTS